jgi:hypothetical protein
VTDAQRAELRMWAAAYVLRSRAEQSLPPQVSDPVVLTQAAQLLGLDLPTKRGQAA